MNLNSSRKKFLKIGDILKLNQFLKKRFAKPSSNYAFRGSLAAQKVVKGLIQCQNNIISCLIFDLVV